jgi:3-hydroxybutyryl-CoA dehydrogenase
VVCGAGTMGSGIAETAAASGYPTLLYDPSLEAIEKSKASIVRNQQQLVAKGKVSEPDMHRTLANLQFHTDIDACKGELIIEAIVENASVKQSLFSALAVLNGPETIFASNTSSLSITGIAEKIIYPERVCGLHFFNPAQVMKLVEVVATPWTSDAVIQTVTDTVRRMGKTPVPCNDSPGFIVNRVARHYYLEPLRIAARGDMELATIDRVLENAGFRMGPFRLMDLIGNDVNLAVTRSLYEAFNKTERFRPSEIQEEKVKLGALGRKTGKGYYTY